MPTYDYECQACQHTFERYQEMSAPKLRTCPACGKRRLIRLVGTGAGVIFKGSGFYETDYKRAAAKGGAKPAAGSPAPAPSDAKGGSSGAEAGASGGSPGPKGGGGAKGAPKA